MPVTDPLQDDAGALVYPHRLRYWLERAQAADRVAVVDMSDHAGPREVAFEALPNARLFAREAPAQAGGRWRPLPFLYNAVVLWLEYTRPPREWWFLPERRRHDWDCAFCGTVDHPRYGGARRRVLETLDGLWPGSRGIVQSGIPFAEVMGLWQAARCGVDLPGQGALCFRLHECLAVGTPLWRPVPSRVALPDGLLPVVFADPRDLPAADPDEVRAVYLEHYAPRAAAERLLDGLQYPISRATSMAAAASR